MATSKYERIARVLRSLAATNQRTGLVFFSDTAYEALPPGTKGSELRPLARFFTYRAGRGRAGFLETPWTGSFRAGTAISHGLRLARHILSRDRLRPGSVLLVSDLADSPFDTSALVQELGRYVQSAIDLRVVPLSASRRDQLLFEEALGEEAIVDPSELLANETVHERRTLVGAFPLALVTAASALLALLAANEHLRGRLSWRSRVAS